MLTFGGVFCLLVPANVPCHGHVRYPHRERAEVLLLSAADILRDAAYLFDPSVGCFPQDGL